MEQKMYWRKPNYQHPQIASQDRTHALYECQPYTKSRRKTKNYGLNIVSKFHKPNVKQKNRNKRIREFLYDN